MTFKTGSAALLLLSGLFSTTALAASADEFEAAYAAAVAHEKEAAAHKNQWPPTVAALKDAKKAAEAHDFDRALALAKQADALAQASLYQSKSEATAWKDAAVP